MYACIHSPGIAAAGIAREFSPCVESADEDTVVFDVAGMGRLLGSPKRIAAAIVERAGPQANVAIAPNRDAAIHAARGYSGVVVIPPGDEAAMLGGLPVEVLHPPPEIQETLDRWGVHTFRDFAGLPEIGLAERLGAAGVRLQKLARGEAAAPLHPEIVPPVFEEMFELEYPVELLEPLSFVLSRLLNQICGRLAEYALAALELRLKLDLEGGAQHERSLRVPVPMRNPVTFLKLIQLDLASHPPSAPVVKVSLAATAAKPRTTQEGLFLPPAPEPEKLELTLARITAIVGEGNAGSPQLVDTHRPTAFQLVKAFTAGAEIHHPPATLAFRVFRPTLAAQVRQASGYPVAVAARGVQGKVLAHAGPWRTSGDWWTTSPWARDDWDIALSDGALYRIYSEHFSGRWFVDGRYD